MTERYVQNYFPFLFAPICYASYVAGKNPHAVALGKLGGRATAESLSAADKTAIGRKAGLIGGRARAEKLSKARRREIAKKAAAARWGKKKGNSHGS